MLICWFTVFEPGGHALFSNFNCLLLSILLILHPYIRSDMKIISIILYGLITIILIVLFNTQMVLPVPLGQLLSPQKGLWQNAEPVDENYSAQLSFPQLQGKVKVYFDEKLVLHVFADNENDA